EPQKAISPNRRLAASNNPNQGAGFPDKIKTERITLNFRKPLNCLIEIKLFLPILFPRNFYLFILGVYSPITCFQGRMEPPPGSFRKNPNPPLDWRAVKEIAETMASFVVPCSSITRVVDEGTSTRKVRSTAWLAPTWA